VSTPDPNTPVRATAAPLPAWSIWAFAFGYFAAYAPYAALTKHLSSQGSAGLSLLPVSTIASVGTMLVYIFATGYHRHARRVRVLGVNLPVPGLWTALSGISSAAIVMTTTLAYTFEGVSIVFMMLLLRGGVLVIAPIVDAITGRSVRWQSWVGLVLSLGALIVAFLARASFQLTVLAAIDVGVYLLAYLIRLRFMSRLAKSQDSNVTWRYFVEEQLVTTPAAVLFLAVFALFPGSAATEIRAGFAMLGGHPNLLSTVIIGVLSAGTGVFGGLVLLDPRETTFTVPVNRASSILAGVVASSSLALLSGSRPPGLPELIGAGLLVAAIVVLALGGKKK
jgi:hypothetical protein